MKRVALIQSQQPSDKPPAFHLLGLWGATQNCHFHFCEKWEKKGHRMSFKIEQRPNVLLSDDGRKLIIIMRTALGCFYFPKFKLEQNCSI